MKILVTGAKGFLAKHLVTRLLSLGYSVIPFDLEEGDLTASGALDAYLDQDIKHVFHLAGKTFVPDSWIKPEGFYRINFNGTLNVLEFCRKSGAKLTHISSYLYGAPEYLPIDENHPLKAYNPYSHSKLIAENTCVYYGATFDVPCCILRPFNVYGPGQPGNFLIQEIIGKVNNPEVDTVEVMDLRPKRDYVFIDDLVDAFVLSIQGAPGIYNLASGVSYSVAEIAQMILEISKINKPIKDFGNERKNEILDLYADISRAETQLKWKPKTSIQQGLKLSVEAFQRRI